MLNVELAMGNAPVPTYYHWSESSAPQVSLLPSGGCRSAARLWRFLRGLRLLDDLRHVFQQFLCVVDYAVLDRPSYSADAFDLPRLIVQPNRARSVQDLQIRDRVFGDDDQIGQFARSDYAELHRPSLLCRDVFCSVKCS